MAAPKNELLNKVDVVNPETTDIVEPAPTVEELEKLTNELID